MRTVLNVGGGTKKIPLPDIYMDWRHLLLDIDPRNEPDVCMDARDLETKGVPDTVDSVYCSHNLEHYYRHDIPKVLAGFKRVVRPDGFVNIIVPNILGLITCLVNQKMDLDAKVYDSAAGPIHAMDMIYGMGQIIADSGSDFMAHKVGFSPAILSRVLHEAEFKEVYINSNDLEITAFAFREAANDRQIRLLKLKRAETPQPVAA
jgi:predicted SAM-dependent methyltransferase